MSWKAEGWDGKGDGGGWDRGRDGEGDSLSRLQVVVALGEGTGCSHGDERAKRDEELSGAGHHGVVKMFEGLQRWGSRRCGR